MFVGVDFVCMLKKFQLGKFQSFFLFHIFENTWNFPHVGKKKKIYHFLKMYQELEKKVLEMNKMIEQNKMIIDEQSQTIKQQQILINELTMKLDQFKIDVKDAIESGVQLSKQQQNAELQQFGYCQSFYALSYIQSFGNAILKKFSQ